MKYTAQQRGSVLGFCVLKHENQKRKYTGDPYHFHLQSVAKMADEKCRLGYEIGLCHDLLEDTETTHDELYLALRRFGYSTQDADFITARVIELTDVYTHKVYPELNRTNRKSLESKRLHKIHPCAQTVKYCDLIDNTASIVEYDKGFAVKYLSEKQDILSGMNKGNQNMFEKCKISLKKANNKLSEYVTA